MAAALGMLRFSDIMSAYPSEAEIIGRIVIGYGELEIALMNCVQMGRGGDHDTVLKAMFRARGELQRIEIADVLGRQVFANLGLEREFAKAIDDMNYCRTIRNQYAHCIWHDDGSGQLGLVNLEEIARDNALVPNLLGLTTRYLDVPLLRTQEAFLANVEHQLKYVNYESRKRQGTPHQNIPAPAPLARPPRYKP
jgi:hypothetical protein